jgi:hypothetical protein
MCGELTGEVHFGTGSCAVVPCLGTSEDSGCTAEPATIDFGTVAIGNCVEKTFNITNRKCAPASVDIGGLCEALQVVSEGSFDLAPGEQEDVTLRYCPTAPGALSCTVETGTPCGATVSCSGTASTYHCSVEPSSLIFPDVLPDGSSQSQYFEIRNDGSEDISGADQLQQPGFLHRVRGGSYTLGRRRSVS